MNNCSKMDPIYEDDEYDYVKHDRHTDTHTMRRGNIYHCNCDYELDIRRDKSSNGIPVTELDNMTYINLSHTHSWRMSFQNQPISLRKNGMFERFFEKLEKIQNVRKTHKYNKDTQNDEITYTVPVCGHLVYSQPIKNNTIATIDDNRKQTKKYIVINNKKYYTCCYYRRSEDGFVPITLPSDSDMINENEQKYVGSTYKKTDTITITFKDKIAINGLYLAPEAMKFEQIYRDDSINKGKNRHQFSRDKNCLRKKRSSISVLKNTPGYISEFEMYYRSDSGAWIIIGKFSGNSHIADRSKIYFDEVIASEYRIVATSHHGSISKIDFALIGKANSSHQQSNDSFVRYTVKIPRHVETYSDKTIKSYRYKRRMYDVSLRDDKKFNYYNGFDDFVVS